MHYHAAVHWGFAWHISMLLVDCSLYNNREVVLYRYLCWPCWPVSLYWLPTFVRQCWVCKKPLVTAVIVFSLSWRLHLKQRDANQETLWLLATFSHFLRIFGPAKSLHAGEWDVFELNACHLERVPHVCCLVAASCGKNWFQRANFWQWRWRIEELFKSFFLHPKVFTDWAVLIVTSVTSKKMTGCIIYLLCRRISSVFKAFLASVGSTSRSLYISVVPNQLVWRSRKTKVCYTKSGSFTDFYSFTEDSFCWCFFFLL